MPPPHGGPCAMKHLFPARFALRGVVLLSTLLGGTAALAQSVDGEILKIDKPQQRITLRHGPIKNIDMPAMSMTFRITDPHWVDTFKVGDKVKFDADKVNGNYTITRLEPQP
jgi:Cu/Ag efflux protein CusF